MTTIHKSLIGWALSVAATLSAVPLFAAGAAAPAPAAPAAGNANSNAGTNAGSNAGTHMGSNAGTNAGSNAGTHTGSNAGTNTGSNAGTNSGSNATNNDQPGIGSGNNTGTPTGPITNTPGVFNNGGVGGVGVVGSGVVGSGDGGIGTVGSSDVGNAPNNAPATQPASPNQNQRSGPIGTQPLTGPITPNHDLTTSNVPPPGTYDSAPTAIRADRQVQMEGQIVDLFSATQSAGPGSAAPSQGAAVTPPGHETAAVAPDARINPTAPAQPPRVSNHGATDSALEATATVRKTNTDTFGTYDHPGVTTALPPAGASPATPPTPAAPAANATPDNAPTVSAKAPGLSLTVNASSTLAPRSFDKDAVSRQLTAGIPAALVANGQIYTLVCDPRQLASEAGQTVRISGRLTSSGALVPDHLETKKAGEDYKEVALTKPTQSTLTAKDR